MQTGPAARARDYTECFPHGLTEGLRLRHRRGVKW